MLVARAAALAWEHGLCGYDAVHLATALFWHETLDEAVTLATYDRELWKGAKSSGLSVWPSALPRAPSSRCSPISGWLASNCPCCLTGISLHPNRKNRQQPPSPEWEVRPLPPGIWRENARGLASEVLALLTTVSPR